MSDNTAIIIASAIAAAGDKNAPDYEARVKAKITEIAVAINDQSYIETVEGVLNAKVFTGIVDSMVLEQTSKRGILTLITKPSSFHPDGKETVRTERTDFDASVLPLMRHIRDNLKGHKVAVWVEMQQSADGTRKFRVLRHIKDLGLPNEADAPQPVGANA